MHTKEMAWIRRLRPTSALLLLSFSVLLWAQQSSGVELTIYTNDRAFIRETRSVSAPDSSPIRLSGLTETIIPESLWIEAGNGAAPTWQKYNANLPSASKQLSHYIGQTLTLVNKREQKEDERVQATLLSAEGGTLWRIGGRVVLNPEYDSIEFPSLPPATVLEPTLEVTFPARPQSVVLQYLAAGLAWKSDYLLALRDNDTADLRALFTVSNNTARLFEDARLGLVAGDVNLVSPSRPGPPVPLPKYARMAAMEAAPAPDVVATELGEYYFYPIKQNVTLAPRSQQQIPHFHAPELRIEKEFRVENQVQFYPMPGRQKQNVAVVLKWENSKAGQLGFPLPRGVVRTFGPDESGRTQFLGESWLKATPENEKVELEIGRAFDVLAERRQLSFDRISDRVSESEHEVEVRNRRKKESRVRILESIGAGDWKILSSTHPYNRLDANRVEFVVTVPAGQTLAVKYRVQARM